MAAANNAHAARCKDLLLNCTMLPLPLRFENSRAPCGGPAAALGGRTRAANQEAAGGARGRAKDGVSLLQEGSSLSRTRACERSAGTGTWKETGERIVRSAPSEHSEQCSKWEA